MANTPIQRQRETWFVTNVSNIDVRITDIPSIPVIKPGKRIDLLVYTSLLTAQSSTVIAAYIANGRLDSEEYLHTHDDKANLTLVEPLIGGDNADDEHKHSHNLLEGLNEGDYIHLTSAEKTEFITLTDGSNADALHTHDIESIPNHNDLTGLNVGDYQHLTASQDGILTGGASSDADSLHTHDGKANTSHTHTLSNVTDVTATAAEINQALDGVGTKVTATNLDTLTDGSNADSLHVHAGGSTPDHNDLNGLNVGDYQHLTSAEKTELDTLTDGSDADSLHEHSHTNLAGVTSDQHHAQLHTIVSHSDTSATGAELNTLTGGGIADTLHKHTASFIDTDTTDFDGALTAADDTSQKAFDTLDDIVGLLVPEQPTAFPSSALSVSSTGSSPLVCSGAIPDNTSGGSLAPPAASVTRVVSSTVSSNTIQDSGPGNSGTITSVVNNASDGSRAMTTGNDDGTYGSLIISDNVDYPALTPGFWMSFDARINNTGTSAGWNRFKITHSGAGDTSDVYFIYDNLNTAPTVSGATVTQNTLGSTAYSSGIEHYNTGAIMNVNTISMTNLSGYTYYGGTDIITIDDAGNGIVGGSETKSFVNLGYATPVAINITTATAFPSNQTVSLDGSNVHTVDNIRYRGRNVIFFT